MRETLAKHARSWHASLGSTRSFPVRRDPAVGANTWARGGNLSSPPRVVCAGALALVALTLPLLGGGATATADPTPTPWIGLAKGQVGSYLWSVKFKRSDDQAHANRLGAERPCLLVGTLWQVGPYSYRRSRNLKCEGDTDHLTASDPPLIASGAQPSTGTRPTMTAVGMIFAPTARQVRITVSSDRVVTIPLRKLSPGGAGSSGLAQVRYAAFAVRGTWCAERLVSLDASGSPLWDSGIDEYACTDPPPEFGA